MKNMRIKKDLRTQLRVKLLPRFMGPLKVLELIGPKAVRVQLPEGTKIHDVFHVSLVEPFLRPDGTKHLHEVPQPLDWLYGLPTYEVDKLLAHRLVTVGRRKILEYLVRWKGCQAESWSTHTSLLPQYSALISAYDLAMAGTPSPVPDISSKPRTPPIPRPVPTRAAEEELADLADGYSLRRAPKPRQRFAVDG